MQNWPLYKSESHSVPRASNSHKAQRTDGLKNQKHTLTFLKTGSASRSKEVRSTTYCPTQHSRFPGGSSDLKEKIVHPLLKDTSTDFWFLAAPLSLWPSACAQPSLKITHTESGSEQSWSDSTSSPESRANTGGHATTHGPAAAFRELERHLS